jgi:uncharacterized protein involved in response to NO
MIRALSANAPLWLVGFRPFFALGALAGIILPLIWFAMVAGGLPHPPSRLWPVQWHAHEMFYGFGWAVVGGFLLTATKNWVKIRGVHGAPLALLAVLWILERGVVYFGALLPGWAFVTGANLFLPGIVGVLVWTLVRHRAQDAFADNYFFLIALPAFIVAKNLMLSPTHFDAGVLMTTGLFRVAFLVMLERTVSGFMQAAFNIRVPLDPRIDLPIKGLAVALVAAAWLPAGVVVAVSVLLAALLAWRLAHWSPLVALSRLDVGIMILGYLAIVLQLLADAWTRSFGSPWVGSVVVHLFSFGPMALIIPAMLVRISKGHTGRPVVFEAADRWALHLMLAGFVLRLLATQAWPGAYIAWIGLAAACWAGCFGLLAWRFVPWYFAPRADGKPH